MVIKYLIAHCKNT